MKTTTENLLWGAAFLFVAALGNEMVDMLDKIDAEEKAKEPVTDEPKPDGYILDGKFYESLDIIKGLHVKKSSKPIPVYFAKEKS